MALLASTLLGVAVMFGPPAAVVLVRLRRRRQP